MKRKPMSDKNYLGSKGKSRRNNEVQPDDDMKDHYDFSLAERGKFYRADAEFHLPVYLEPDVNDFLTRLAEQKKVTVDNLTSARIIPAKYTMAGIYFMLNQSARKCDIMMAEIPKFRHSEV